ncbi:RabGAP/TBC [Sistotremastrum niveocremeum HHB9708]|uniref:RabGAP/TBC n=1 Tax=Sistotremastrum niveocremeum HHB9708 TaxID=1314777 RepID=A0A165AFL0_9AGAM|nr:RabGAP/TBC [Sistotremastrum niveocremeum HHB9708]
MRLETSRAAFENIFHGIYTLPKIKEATMSGRLFRGGQDQHGTAGRSMAWKLFLLPGSNTPLGSPQQPSPSPSIEYLRQERPRYVQVLKEKMRAPDGSYEEGFVLPGHGSTSPEPSSTNAQDWDRNNPLSLDDENPWREWFTANELRKTIRQDVERTFPDLSYFRDPDVQQNLTTILFLHSITNPRIGYRQGMHELLACLYQAIDFDSVDVESSSALSTELSELCDRAWVAADAWTLFGKVMKGVGEWYEWQEPPPAPGAPPPTANVPFVAPIVTACNHMHNTILREVDPRLWQSMQAAGIEPQIYGIRWLRLLFTREFSLEDAMLIWDGLFAYDPSFQLSKSICVAMLIRIRNKIIPSDYSTQLTYLLRYPAPPISLDVDMHHTSLLLRQATAIHTSPTTLVGQSIVYENRNVLDIPVDIPDPPPPMPRRTRASAEAGRSKQAASTSPRREMGLPELIARGLIDRGETLGINKTLSNTILEIRRNLPDLTQTLNRSSSSSTPSEFTSISLVEGKKSEERPPWEPRSRFEVEKEVADLRLLLKQLSGAVGNAIDVLLQNDEDSAIHNKKREALECLDYVREVLGRGGTGEIDEERLYGETEYQKRREAAREKEERAKAEAMAAAKAKEEAAAKLRVTSPQAVASFARAPSAIAPSREHRHRAALPPRDRHPPIALTRTPMTPPILSPHANPRVSPAPPWEHTPSNFSSSPLADSLPRLPPASTSTRSIGKSSPASSYPPHSHHQMYSNTEEPHKRSPPHDPLGVLP